MPNLYSDIVSLFGHLANLFFWPVAVALLVLFTWSLLDLGRMFYQAWRRRKEPRTDLIELANALHSHSDLSTVHVSSAVLKFWTEANGRILLLADEADLDLWLEEILQQHEIAVTSALDRSRALVRLGPMLGLAGTIIPLGPALQSLLGGDMAAMVNHLVVGFGAVVCGLVLSGIAYAITLVRERWARVDLKELENFCELVLRNRRRTPEVRARGDRHAHV